MRIVLCHAVAFAALSVAGCHDGWRALLPVLPEQRTLSLRDPAELRKAPLPDVPPPPTVSDPQRGLEETRLSLDEAIRLALANSKVVRLLAGIGATSSGRTIYDPAISNTLIDQQQARFDPRLELQNTFNRSEQPQAVLDPSDPSGTRITGLRADTYNLNLGLSQTNVTGGTASLTLTDDLSRLTPGVFALNPQNRSSVALGYTQPLLQGAGVAVNLAPVVIARLNTERSYFEFKDSVQESVRGVIEAYWALVFARTDVWARQQQVQQGQAALDRAAARKRQGLGSAADVAQAQAALANFRAGQIGAEANVLQREAALRNILGLPPSGTPRLVPVSPPTANRLKVNWEEIVTLAEERRPDLIELKLVLEADEQMLTQARNNALPKLDAVALYRWNGLDGTTPRRVHASTNGGEFTDWTLGVNFSVPLGLRQGRAALRQQELILLRDRANLEQGLHQAIHILAGNTRNLAQFYEQYAAFKEARAAARANLDQQLADFRAGRAIFLNVLQAITDWGNSVSAEAQSLAQYNTELANLERQTGTILDTHGVHFFEERYASIGPLCRRRCYPASLPPGPNADVYPVGAEPAENFFNLKSPLQQEQRLVAPERIMPEIKP